MSETYLSRVERAIRTTAQVIVRHNLPQILPTLKRLEAERDRLLCEAGALAYAQKILNDDRMKLAA